MKGPSSNKTRDTPQGEKKNTERLGCQSYALKKMRKTKGDHEKRTLEDRKEKLKELIDIRQRNSIHMFRRVGQETEGRSPIRKENLSPFHFLLQE